MPIVLIIMSVLIGHLVFKYVRRRRFLVHLRKARIMPTELKRRLDAGDDLVIVDLRTALDIEPSALPNPASALDRSRSAAESTSADLARQRDRVLLRGAREATSAQIASLLMSRGFKNVHPLSGGLEGWRQAGFVVESLEGLPGSQPPRRSRDRACGRNEQGEDGMIWGMTIATFTFIHVLISLIGIATGLVVMAGLIAEKDLWGWTPLFLVTTVATS